MVDQQQATSNGENNNAGQQTAGTNYEKRCWQIAFDSIDESPWERIIADICRRVKEGIASSWPEESWRTFILWILSIIVDPLGLYAPRINVPNKSLDFDRSFLFIISTLYVVIYIYQLSIYVYKFKKSAAPSYSKSWWIFIVLAPLVPIVTTGLLQLLLLFEATKRIRASLFSFGMVIFLLLYLLRVLGIYRLFVATALRESEIFRILNNFLLYLYGAHLFGGLWYLFAVWKKMECWNMVCTKFKNQCHYDGHSHRFMSWKDNGILDNSCFISKPEDTTNGFQNFYEWGIFKDALESHIVETKDIMKKLFYCLRWGTQSLSGFGQDLSVSTQAWENIFVLLIAVYGTITFTLFIANMQNLVKPSTTRWTRQNLEKWSPFGKLTREDKNLIVEKCQQCNWPQTGVVNVKNLLTSLPKDVEYDIKRILCSKLLGKVKEYGIWSDELLNELCECAKPVSYEKHTQIVQNGSSINEMLFVVQGKLRIFSFTSANADSPGNTLISHLEDDSFCGEELLGFFQAAPNSSQLPVSRRTIRVVEQVDAFAITSYDLQNVFIQRQADLTSSRILATSTN